MSVKRLLGLGLLGAGLSTGIATAQTCDPETFDPASIAVWAWNGETPSAGYDAGYVEVRNNSTFHVRVKVTRKIRNPPAHYNCPGCESVCDGAGTISCTFGRTDVLELTPGACNIAKTVNTSSGDSAPDCMPANDDLSHDCCDNDNACSDAVKVCSANLITPCSETADCIKPGAPGGICILDGVCSDNTTACHANGDCPPAFPTCKARPFCSVYTTVEVSVIEWWKEGCVHSLGDEPVCGLWQATYRGGPSDPINDGWAGVPTCGHSTSCSTHVLIRHHCGFPNGTSCASSNDCTSGVCADGVCCDNACDGVCQACTAAKKGSGVNGVCDAISAGTDPDNECTGTCPCN